MKTKLTEIFQIKESSIPPEADKVIRKLLDDTIHIAERKLAVEFGYTRRADTVKIVKQIVQDILQKIESEAGP